MTISIFKWFGLIKGLRKKGNGVRESGAFLVAKTGSMKISKVIFYDDLDPNAFSSGIIVFEGIYHSKLNKLLKEFKGEVIADIHTHPIGCSIKQSVSDMNHPMCRLKGHVAFIAPDYATNSFLIPKQCAAYLYKGSFIWQTLVNNNFPLKITLL
jgi:hypothetical protein